MRSAGALPKGGFVHALIGHIRAVPCHMQRQEHPILIVDKRAVDVVLDRVVSAVDLAASIGNFDGFARFIPALVVDRIGFRLPYPPSRLFAVTPGVADGFDLAERVESVCLRHLFGKRRELLRVRDGRHDQQRAEGQELMEQSESIKRWCRYQGTVD